MRRSYLVAYDIRDPKRLRRVHKLVKAYGEPWQLSVFYCVLKDIDRARLENDLRELIHHRVDQVLILDLGPDDATVRERAKTLGPALPEPESGYVVI